MSEQAAFCNKCGFCGKPDRLGFHSHPIDGQTCKYAAQTRTLETHMTDQDHAKIVPNGEPFTDEDGYAVADEILEYFEHYQIATLAPIASIIRRERHNARLAAEAAAFEKAAGVAEKAAGAAQPYSNGIGLGPACERARMGEALDIASSIRKLAGEKHDAQS